MTKIFFHNMRLLCAWLILFIFGLGQCVLPNAVAAQNVQRILAIEELVDLSPRFTPATMKGIELFEDNPLYFNFLIDQGDQDLSPEELKRVSTTLIKYFLVTLTVPEEELWVNLSPYERERIISEGLGQTEMGRDLLAQDYLLKQLSASVMYPEKELGQSFWDRVYGKIYDQYQTTDVQLNTFNKIWIVPDDVLIYVSGNRAFVARNTFKVLLEKDYLSEMKQRDIADTTGASVHVSNAMDDPATDESLDALSAQVVREILLPEIQKEVNEGENFAVLRQIYNSMLLATWYKRNLKESLLGSVYMNQNKTTGVELRDKAVKQRIYERYLSAFKKGVFNYIKEEFDPASQAVIPRKYFSGGTEGYQRLEQIPQTSDFASLTKETQDSLAANKFVRITSSFLEITPRNKDLLLGTTEPDLDSAMLDPEDRYVLEFIGRMSAELKADVEQINQLIAAGNYNPALGLLMKWKNFYTGKTAQNRLDRIQNALDWVLDRMAAADASDLDREALTAQALEDISDEQVPEKPAPLRGEKKLLSIRGRMAESDRDLLNRINIAYLDKDLITTRDLLMEWINLFEKGPRQDAGRAAARQVQSEIDAEVARIRDADQSEIQALTNLNRQGFRSVEPWFFKGSGSEALVRTETNELVVSVFERIVQQTITQVAQSNFFEEMQPRVQVSGKMRYLMSGKFDSVNINFSEDYFDLFSQEDFDNLITLFVNALNDVVRQISPGANVVPGRDITNPVLNVLKEDGQVITFRLNISTTNNPFDYVQKIRGAMLGKLRAADPGQKAEGIISAEYYLERDLQRYIQMRTSYETQTAEDFIDNVGQEKIDDFISKLDRPPVYVLNNIRSRLEDTARPFAQAVEGNQQVIGKEILYPVWNLIDQGKRDFPGRAILTTILHRLIDHDRIVYRDDVPDAFWSFRDKDTGNYYIAVARSLQPVIESMSDISRWNEGEQRTLMTFIAAKLLNKATEIAMEPDPLVDWRLEDKDPTISNTMTVAYLTELRFLATFSSTADDLQLIMRGNPPILELYRDFLPSQKPWTTRLGEVNKIEASDSRILPFLSQMGVNVTTHKLSQVRQFDAYIRALNKNSLKALEDQGTFQSASLGYPRTGDGQGYIVRDLSSNETEFMLNLANGLAQNGIPQTTAEMLAQSLVRLRGGSIALLRKHNVLTQEDLVSIANLNLAGVDIPRLSAALSRELKEYDRNGFSQDLINKLITTHLLPNGEIKRLRLTYMIKPEDLNILEEALTYQRVEAWVQRVRAAQGARGTILQKNIRRHDASVPLRTDEERRKLLQNLHNIASVLKERAFITRQGSKFVYRNISQQPTYYAVDVARSRESFQVGDYVRDLRTGNIFYVGLVKEVGSQIRLFSLSRDERVDPQIGYLRLPETGEMEVLDRADEVDVTPLVELTAVLNAIEKLRTLQLAGTRNNFNDMRNFAAISRILPMAQDTRDPDDINVPFRNPNIPFERVSSFETKGDRSQELAVRFALNKNQLLIINGPPGAGKSSVIKEVAYQEVLAGKDVIISSEMHQAVDNPLKDLIEEGMPALRLGNNPSDFKYGTERVWSGNVREGVNPEVMKEFSERSQRYGGGHVFGATSIGLATSGFFEKFNVQVDTLILDETSTMTLSKLIVALRYLKPGGKIIIVGDTKQLPPSGVRYDEADRVKRAGVTEPQINLYNRSALNWVKGQKVGDEIMLSTNYRAHSLLASLVSYMDYNGELNVNNWQPFDQYTLRLVDISRDTMKGGFFERSYGTSYHNPHTVKKARALIEQDRVRTGYQGDDLLYISTYRAQTEKMQAVVSRLDAADQFLVSTIDGIQGGEAEIVYKDLVRSNANRAIGHSLDDQRDNVANSRPRKELVVLYDSRTLGHHPRMKKLLHFYNTEVKPFFADTLDEAMLADSESGYLAEQLNPQVMVDETVGGINLNPQLFDLQIIRDDQGVPVPLRQQPVVDMDIEGFLPVIINITPITNTNFLLGIHQGDPQQPPEQDVVRVRPVEKISLK